MKAKYTPWLLGTALLHSEFNRTCKLSHNILCPLQAHDASHMPWFQHRISKCEVYTEDFLVMFRSTKIFRSVYFLFHGYFNRKNMSVIVLLMKPLI